MNRALIGFCLFAFLSIAMTTTGRAQQTETSSQKQSPIKRSVQTASGRISYTEQGTGPVALFVHGVLLNGHLWRHQLAGLSDIRRNIAVDLLAHGDTEIAADQDVSVTANAKMLKEFLDALKIDQVDLVGNDSGGGIAQIFAASYPERVRSFTLTNCDTHDNWPPEPFKPFLKMAASGGLRGTLDAMLADKSVYRSPQALGPAYERPEKLSDETIETYLRPLVRTEQRTRDVQRFLAAFDNKHTLAIEPRLKTLKAPTLIVWGTDDVFFDVKWSRWLADTIPGTRRRVEFKGARIFFPEERWEEFNKELRAHWQNSNTEELIDRYFDSLNETDGKRRRDLTKQVWAEKGKFGTPYGEVEGIDAIDALVAGVQKQFPNSTVRRTSKIDEVGNYLRWSFTLSEANGKPVLSGVDFAIIAGGKLQLVMGFFDFAPNLSNSQTTNNEELIDRYFDSLNESDSKRRLDLIKQVWSEKGKSGEVEGYDAIDAGIEKIQKQFPNSTVRRTGKIDGFGNYRRWSFTLSEANGKPIFSGVDFAIIADRKLQQMMVFFDFAPSPSN